MYTEETTEITPAAMELFQRSAYPLNKPFTDFQVIPLNNSSTRAEQFQGSTIGFSHRQSWKFPKAADCQWE